MRIEQEAPQKRIDITALYFKFKEKWRNVFIYRLGEQDFIYRALGRKEFKDILDNKLFNDYEKEEVICDQCLLYPEEYDWENCDAGVPTELMKNILKNSYLDSIKSRKTILTHYRNEMFDLDNQMTAIILEAFPNLSLEQVEQWDVEKTMKFYSRAEWTLHNIRGVPFAQQSDIEEEIDGNIMHTEELQPAPPPQRIQAQPQATRPQKTTTIRGGNKANKLTPEKIKEMEEFQKKFPQFNLSQDNGWQGIDGLAQSGVDVESPALRPGF